MKNSEMLKDALDEIYSPDHNTPMEVKILNMFNCLIGQVAVQEKINEELRKAVEDLQNRVNNAQSTANSARFQGPISFK